MTLDLSHFTTATTQEELVIFAGNAVRALYQLKENKIEAAIRDGKLAYQFALDNVHMEIVEFSRQTMEIVSERLR